MIRIECRVLQGALCGFRIAGHAGAGQAGEDIVCAAVSSAAYMAANTITDVLLLPADITVRDGYMELTVTGELAPCQAVLSGFRLHMQAMQEQYPERVHLKITEV